jgi:hypothetical protein
MTDTPMRRHRFERDARVVSTFSHPNICPLFDVGEHDRGRATTRTPRGSSRAHDMAASR